MTRSFNQSIVKVVVLHVPIHKDFLQKMRKIENLLNLIVVEVTIKSNHNGSNLKGNEQNVQVWFGVGTIRNVVAGNIIIAYAWMFVLQNLICIFWPLA